MADNRKYLDYAGLSEFWSLVKNYYSETVSKANSALQGVSVKEVRGTTVLDVVDNVVTVDLSNYATLQDISKGINFKGVVATAGDLPTEGNKAGDLYFVKEGSKEFIWVPADPEKGVEAHWEELGSLINLENYYTKDQVNELLSTEASARESADATLQGNLDAEVEARKAADAAEVVARDDAIVSAFEDGLYSIKLHDIRKLFGTTSEVSSSEDLVSALTNAGLGDTINLSSSVSVSSPLSIPDGKDVTLDLSNGGTIDSGEARSINVGQGSTVEITGGTVTCNSSNYQVVCGADSSIVIDGSVIENNGSGVAIGTNGLNYNGDLIIKNATITGTNYFPACGNLVIENSTFSVPAACSDSCAIYCKSGSVTIRNSTFTASTKSNGDWIHYNNGYYGISCAAIFENCNYGDHGNLTIDIDADSQFIVYDAPSGATYKNFGILVIDYDGNTSESIKINQKYYKAEVSNVLAAPYVHFNTEAVEDADHRIVVVEEVNF